SCSPCHSFLFHLLLLWSPLFPYTTLFRSQISATDVNCPLRMSCADLLQGCYSSDRLDVLRDDLVGWGSIGCRDVLPEGALDSGSGAALSNYGYGYRMRCATMAGVAGDRLLGIKVVPVNGSHHLHHPPRGLLGFLVIFLQSPFHVAITAFHAQRVSDELHGRDELISRNFLQHLNILICLCCRHCARWRCVCRCRLHAQRG